jgi:hypothetical protein
MVRALARERLNDIADPVRKLGQDLARFVERVNDFDTAGGRSLGSEFWFL